MHAFFEEIKSNSDLIEACKADIESLPKPFTGENTIKAILLGADPTNDGTKKDRGLKELEFVFGINGEFEKDFFALQAKNLSAIGLSKENCFIQNVCRNYFKDQTTENKNWFIAAGLWKKYLLQEISIFDPAIPVLTTSGEVFEVLTGIKGPYTNIYLRKTKLPFFSEYLQRPILPLFRGRAYMFYKDKWMDYRNYLKNYFAE